MLRDSVRGYLGSHWPVAQAVAWAGDAARVQAIFTGLAGQGLADLCSGDESGGLPELCLVMEELGRAACPAPVLSAALMTLAAAQALDAPAAFNALMARVHAGSICPGHAFAGPGGDAGEGSLRHSGGKLSGEVNFAEALHATHLAVIADGGVFVVGLASGQVQRLPTPAMGETSLCQLRFDQAEAIHLPLPQEAAAALAHIARLACASRALGAATQAFDMAVEHARQRVQFGKPIGSFQAIQHKLANGYIALQGVRLACENAALQHARGSPHWRWHAAAAGAQAAGALRQVSLETHHALGAIGYAEEHEAPRHFRRVHLDTLRHGGTRAAREMLAAHFLGAGTGSFPGNDLGPAGDAFREDVRAWLEQHWSGERKAAHDALPFAEREFDSAFARELGQTGWLALAWPRESGGQGRGAMEQLAFMEMMERAEAPRTGAPVQAAMLQAFGTPAQQTKYLPEILRGEAMFGMGYSEPQAGSDLASLKTSAVREGDHYVINGQKIWTTTYWGRYMLLATRTSAGATPAHAGLSMFIVPMDTPGITVRPSRTMYGGTFANIFYDNVRVPADAMVGAEGEGWKVLTGALVTERGFVGGGIVLKVAHLFELLCSHLRSDDPHCAQLRSDPLVRDRLGELAAQIEAGRRMMLHCAQAADQGTLTLHDAAASKVFSGELMERFGETALDILGLQGALGQGAAGSLLNGRIEQALRHSLMWVISIGTNEIQRSLIAQRGLGLPR